MPSQYTSTPTLQRTFLLCLVLLLQVQQLHSYYTPCPGRTRAALPALTALKDSASSLLDAGKVLALCGEEFISTDPSGAAPTPRQNAGARIRNAGDALAEAGAKARFKSGAEGVSVALRTASEELEVASSMMAQADEDVGGALKAASQALEKAGWGVAVSEEWKAVAAELVVASDSLETCLGEEEVRPKPLQLLANAADALRKAGKS